jgi:hypothetical protein
MATSMVIVNINVDTACFMPRDWRPTQLKLMLYEF